MARKKKPDYVLIILALYFTITAIMLFFRITQLTTEVIAACCLVLGLYFTAKALEKI